jgi:recyclin-1
MAHKRQVMKAFQSILFAPVTLTTSLATNTVKLFTAKKPSNLTLNDIPEQKSKGETVRSEDVESEEPTSYNLDDDSMTSMISLELCVKLLHINKEALGRALVITYAIDSKRTRSSVEKIFVALLKAIGEQHIKPAFKLFVSVYFLRVCLLASSAFDRLNKSEPRDGDDYVNAESLQFFELIHLADLISQMVDVYYQEDIVSFPF